MTAAAHDITPEMIAEHGLKPDEAARMAEILGEDIDEWTAMAGRLTEDLPAIIHEEPKGVPDLLRAVQGMTADQLRKLREEAERMKKEEGD